ncbi:MAG: BlaI/MecI/CopY family transcriptional regulator [Planctomycetaceae bacterium]|nr:BlaI/MecI/CopY family transcriptional regulator [Planctomycetaceae bacterium]
MNKPANITDAEWNIMLVLWDKGSATISEITATVKRDRDISTQTIKTLIRRLIDKELVGYAIDPHDARIYHYRPLVRKEEAVEKKSDAFIAQVYQSKVGDLIAHFVEKGDLSEDELVSLQSMLKKKLSGR